jgi:alkanesulfonate monooxygenase SsuD/methylene tetrahydromethanopterin reductase-like flavin-dependent oxidoreductase (luciferase family)
VRFAIGLPNVGAYGDPGLLVELGSTAEQSGWDGVFIWDHVAYREPGWPVADPQVAVAALAASTKQVRLGVVMVALPRRRPWKVARELASLDVLSGGRATFGAGLGSQALQEYEAFGEQGDAKVRAERLDEALEVVVGLWSGAPFTYQGKYYTVTNGQFLPRPVQQPRIPVWIAGRWPARRPFARAARWDGVFPTHVDVGHAQTMSPVQLEDIVTYTLSQRNPSADPFDVIIEGHTDAADSSSEARRIADYEDVGLTWWVEKLGWFRGSVDDMRQRIQAGPPRR